MCYIVINKLVTQVSNMKRGTRQQDEQRKSIFVKNTTTSPKQRKEGVVVWPKNLNTHKNTRQGFN